MSRNLPGRVSCFSTSIRIWCSISEKPPKRQQLEDHRICLQESDRNMGPCGASSRGRSCYGFQGPKEPSCTPAPQLLVSPPTCRSDGVWGWVRSVGISVRLLDQENIPSWSGESVGFWDVRGYLSASRKRIRCLSLRLKAVIIPDLNLWARGVFTESND